MIRILRSVKYHWSAVILAVILGFLMVLPFFYFQVKLGSDFRGIFPQFVDDEMFYYARIKDVIDGHIFLSNAYLFEHKDGSPQQLFLAEYILAQPIKLLNLNINTAHLIYNFLLPAVAFFLTYLGLYLITKSRFWSIISSSFLFFGLYLITFIRPVSPQFNFIFWLSQFIFLWLLIDKRGSTRIEADQRGEKTELLYGDITYKIRGACYKVWKDFRGGFNEKLIERALIAEFINIGLKVENQKRQDIFYYDQKVGTQIFDIIVDDRILIELKSLPFLKNESRRQFWTYLKKSPYKLGLLINFGNKLQIERKIFDIARLETENDQLKSARIDSKILRESALNPHKSALVLLNILNFGLLFYIYPYYWTFYLIFFGILIAAYFWENREFALKIAAIAAGGLVLAIPYFYLNYLSARLPYYTETLTRISMIYSRFPSGLRIIFWSILGFAIFGWFLWRKIIKWNVKTMFFVSGILASIIAVNQHLITGKNFEFSSHYDMGAMFFLVFSAVYLLSFTNRKRIITAAIILIVFLVIFSGLRNYSNQSFAIGEGGIYIQNYAPIFDWLNKNTKNDSVVYANNSLSGLIPVYTANNVFYHRNANSFFISDDEVLDRFILNSFFSAGGEISPLWGGEYFNKDFIIENTRSVYGNRYVDAYGHAVQGNKLRRFLGLKTEPEIYLPKEAIQRVILRAQELQKNNFLEELKKYRVDYLVWDKNKNPNWRIGKKYFNSVFENNNIVVYAANFD